jgi:YfiH family protein
VPGTSLAFSTREDGDFRIDGDHAALAVRRAGLVPGEWTWLRQVHGGRVVVVDRPGDGAGEHADAAVTDRPGCVLAVHTADCLPLLLRSTGVVGAAHVGWRGLLAGVVESTVDAMAALGAGAIAARIGPHIRSRCYEFGAGDLDAVADRYGDGVRATTAAGAPALDLLAGVRAALGDRPQVDGVLVETGCTACEPDRFFSHRARADRGRHSAAITLLP